MTSSSTMPVIKKISKNGQISLPKSYRGTYIQCKKVGNGLMLEPMFWDEDLEIWLTEEEKNDLAGETIWSAKKDNKSVPLSLDKISAS